MRRDGLAARTTPPRAVLRTVLLAAVIAAMSGCGQAATLRPPDPARAVDTHPVNVNEELVAMTMDMAGLVAPYRVVGIRLGILGDLRGVPRAERAAVAAWQGTDTTELDLAAWEVELVGTQRPSVCGGATCEPRYTFVEAYLTQDRECVIGITMRQLLPGDPLIPSST